MTAFEDRYGFSRHEAGIANWRNLPYARFSFQATREFMPTAAISCADPCPDDLPADDGPLAGFRTRIEGTDIGAHDFLERSATNLFVVFKDGRIAAEWSAPHANPAAPHILFSVTKSVTGVAAGILEDRGLLDPAAPVSHYLPDAQGSAYGDATVRDLLDMRVSLDFDESYLNKDGDYDRYRRATLWNPQRSDKPQETAREVLTSLPKGPKDHGGPFYYASPNTDVLALVVEQAAGQRYADFVASEIWHKIGARSDASITVDGAGAPRGAGGMCATARDLARFGEMIRLGGGDVVSSRWVDDMRLNGDREAWTTGNFPTLFPDGRYRSCWYQTGYESGAYCGIGIHGQWLYVDPTNAVTIVKLSSQATPLDDAADHRCLAFFQAVAAAI